jgi:hypothetical protein
VSCRRKGTTETEIAAEQDVSGSSSTYVGSLVRCNNSSRHFACSAGRTNEGERDGRNTAGAGHMKNAYEIWSRNQKWEKTVCNTWGQTAGQY